MYIELGNIILVWRPQRSLEQALEVSLFWNLGLERYKADLDQRPQTSLYSHDNSLEDGGKVVMKLTLSPIFSGSLIDILPQRMIPEYISNFAVSRPSAGSVLQLLTGHLPGDQYKLSYPGNTINRNQIRKSIL